MSTARVTCNDILTGMARRRGQRRGHLFVDEDAGMWRLRYRPNTPGDRNQQQVTIGPARGPGKLTEKQAERFAWDHYLSKIDQGVRAPRALVPLGQFWDQQYWPAAQLRLKASTQVQYASFFRRWIEPELGAVKLSDIGLHEIERVLAAARAGGLAGGSVAGLRKVVSAIFARARKLGYHVGENPASLVELPTPRPAREPYALDFGQAWAIMRWPMGEHYRYAVEGALLTGCNAAELAGLRWESTDGDVIRIREQFVRGAWTSPKTRNRERGIPLTDPLRDLLERVRERGRFLGPRDPVFAGRTGEPFNVGYGQKVLRKAGEAIGLEHLGWHAFRHSVATWLERAEVGYLDRQALLGHASRSMTDRYTHRDWDRVRDGLERTQRAFIEARPVGGAVIQMKRSA